MVVGLGADGHRGVEGVSLVRGVRHGWHTGEGGLPHVGGVRVVGRERLGASSAGVLHGGLHGTEVVANFLHVVERVVDDTPVEE